MSNAATKRVAKMVLQRLRSAGFQALFAGGCVRDMLLGVPSSDYDVATDATPDQVRKLFRRVLLVGAKFGVAMVIVDKLKVEVTTFRSDLSYQDGRRPTGVIFTGPREDALRRDFTINGMFYDPLLREVIDYVDGRSDLRRGVIRTIGSPRERFGEDYLRLVRAVRFAVRLGFKVDPATAAAVRQYAPHIASISGERIFEELSKMLSLPSAPEALVMLRKFGLAEVILPDLLGAPGLWRRAMWRVKAVADSRDVVLVMGALLAELPPKRIEDLTRRWGASNELRSALCWMAEHLHDWRAAAVSDKKPGRPSLKSWPPSTASLVQPVYVKGRMPLHQFKRLLANPHFERLRRIWRAAEMYKTGSQSRAGAIKRRLAAIRPGRIAPPPLVTGKDIKALGLSEGPQLGRILRTLYDAQLDERIVNRRQALDEARRMIAQGHARPGGKEES